MGKYLMCKDKEVYELDTEEVYRKELLPGKMAACPCRETYQQWMDARRAEPTNTYAAQVRHDWFAPMENDLQGIDLFTHAYSLSDCYWIRTGDGVFASPYDSCIIGDVPLLYTNGALPKYWKNNPGTRTDRPDTWARPKVLAKQTNAGLELSCIRLCKACGIPSVHAEVFEDRRGRQFLAMENFTSLDVMYEPAAVSGRLDPEEFTDEDIVRLFGAGGIRMLTIDAITGNGDRHAGNFGWLRSPDTGEYLCMAPLYDFDHALDSSCTDRMDILMEELLAVSKGYETEIRRICDTASRFPEPVFAARAAFLQKLLHERNQPGNGDPLLE
jgi:hypothetical protein